MVQPFLIQCLKELNILKKINDSLFESFAVGGATQGTMRTASNIGGAVTPNFIKRGLGGNPNQTAFGESSIEKAENEAKTGFG